MVKEKSFETFPVWIPLVALLVSLIGYSLGAIILSRFGLAIVVLYLVYCLCIELLVVFRSCKNCYYYNKVCGLGKGSIAPILTKKGDKSRFVDRKISWYDLLPDFLVGIIPIIGGIILLINDFSYNLVGLIILLAVIFFGGTGYIRGSFACKYCRQKEIGCPAQRIFSKEKSV